MAPPLLFPVTILLLKVLPLTSKVRVLELLTAPPPAPLDPPAEFPEKVELVMVNEEAPPALIAPPEPVPVAALFVKVQLVNDIVELLAKLTAPPLNPAVFPPKELFITFKVTLA